MLVVAVLAGACSIPPLEPTGRACPCVEGWTCNRSRGVCERGTGGVVVVSNLRAAWTTAHTVRWEWDADGFYTSLRQPIASSYGLFVGRTREEVERRATLWSATRNPELAFNRSGYPVRATITDEHPPDSDVWAQVLAIDKDGKESLSEPARARTTPAPAAGTVVFGDSLPPGAAVNPPWLTVRNEAGLCRGGACLAGTTPPGCTDTAEGCGDNIQFLRLNMTVPAFSRERFERTAVLEFAIATNSAAPPHSSWVWIDFGGVMCRLDRLSLRNDDRYHVVQLPLRMFRCNDRPLTFEALDAWRMPPGDPRSPLGLRAININVRVTSGTTVRLDDVALRW